MTATSKKDGSAPNPASFPLPPSNGYPLIGALPKLLPDPLRYIMEARSKLGEIYTLDLGVMKVIALNHPRHAQYILRDNARNYRKGGPLWDTTREVIGNGLPVSEGDIWLRQRRMIQPQFHRERLASMLELMVDAVDEAMADWDRYAESGEPFEAYRAFSHVNMNVIVRTMFGADISSEEADIVRAESAIIIDYVLAAMFVHSVPRWLPVPGRRRFEQACRKVDETIYKLIARHRTHGSGKGGDLIGMLLDSVDAETGSRMTDQQARDEAVSIFLAGYETSAAMLAFSLASIGQNPSVAKALYEEIDAVVAKGAMNKGQISLGLLSQLPLTLMVFQETTRLYPAAYWIPRTAVEDDVIEGFRIPAGTMVGVMVYTIHRHPDFWEEPERFDPWRFTPERAAGRNPLAWIPFGAGQRLCIGKDLSLTEAQLVLARVLARYEFELLPGHEVKPELAFTMRPKGGVWLRLKKRAKAAAPVGTDGQAAATG